MGYYKGDKIPGFGYNHIVDSYIQGCQLKRINNKNCRVNIKEGATKHNVEMLRWAKELRSGYTNLIIIETFLTSLAKKYKVESAGVTGNLWHIMHAQKGTATFLSILEEALKKYMLCNGEVYTAIKQDLQLTDDRLKRNTIFVNEFVKQAGLDSLNRHFESQNTTFYDYAHEFSNQYYLSHTEEYKEDRDKYYKNAHEAFCNELTTFAKSAGIDISHLMEEKAAESIKISIKAKEEIKQKKLEKRIAKAAVIADSLFIKNMTLINSAIDTGNTSNQISRAGYNRLISKLNHYRGVCYVIVRASGSRVTYYSEQRGNTTSLAFAKYFPNKEAANKILKEISNNSCIYAVERISFPDKANKPDEKYDEYEYLITHQNDILHNSLINKMRCDTKNILKRLKENGNTLYYINAIDHKHEKALFVTAENKGTVSENQRPTFYRTKDEAEEALNNCMDNKKLAPYDLVITEYTHTHSAS